MNLYDIISVANAGSTPEEISNLITSPPRYSSAFDEYKSNLIKLAKLVRIKENRMYTVCIRDVKMTERTYPDLLKGQIMYNAFSSTRSTVNVDLFNRLLKDAISTISNDISMVSTLTNATHRELFTGGNSIALTAEYIDSVINKHGDDKPIEMEIPDNVSSSVLVISNNFDLFTKAFANELHKVAKELENDMAIYYKLRPTYDNTVASLIESRANHFCTFVKLLKASLTINLFIYNKKEYINSII